METVALGRGRRAHEPIPRTPGRPTPERLPGIAVTLVEERSAISATPFRPSIRRVFHSEIGALDLDGDILETRSRRSGAFWQELGLEPADREKLATVLSRTQQVRLLNDNGQLGREVACSRALDEM